MTGKSSKKSKDIGLGRGLASLLEDNTPEISARPQVIRRNEHEDARLRRENSNNLYKKEGAISYVKTPKPPRS